VSIRAPDKSGTKKDVVLGYDHLQAWVSGKPWFNSIVGRHAGRIRKGQFTLDSETYQLEQNNNGNHLHGTAQGFNAKCFESKIVKSKDNVGVEMRYVSPDGEEGYPGELAVTTAFRLLPDNTLQLEFHAEVTKKSTIVNLCNHAYYNLSGEPGSNTVLDHHLTLNAAAVTELDELMIPTGKLPAVQGTPYDFNTKDAAAANTIGSRIAELNKTLPEPGGYDINYVLIKDHLASDKNTFRADRLVQNTLSKEKDEDKREVRCTFAARLEHRASGRIMDVYTSAPGIQLYTGNFLDGQSLVGRGNVAYKKHAALCLETQTFPDGVNHQEEWKNFPSDILRPEEKYVHFVQHRFHTEG
jgi:aldose 1-epimerase